MCACVCVCNTSTALSALQPCFLTPPIAAFTPSLHCNKRLYRPCIPNAPYSPYVHAPLPVCVTPNDFGHSNSICYDTSLLYNSICTATTFAYSTHRGLSSLSVRHKDYDDCSYRSYCTLHTRMIMHRPLCKGSQWSELATTSSNGLTNVILTLPKTMTSAIPEYVCISIFM